MVARTRAHTGGRPRPTRWRRARGPSSSLLVAAVALGIAACGSGGEPQGGVNVPGEESGGELDTSGDAPGTISPPDTDSSPGGGDGAAEGGIFSDQLLESAIAAAESDPLQGLPSRDAITTAALHGELADGGYDLTGMRITVYPDSTAPSFLLVETDDSSALVEDEDAAGEDFVLTVMDSPAVADAGVEHLVLRHSGTDDEGPYVLSFVVPLADLRAAVTDEVDIADAISVQVERP